MPPPKITVLPEPAEGIGLGYARLAPWNAADAFEMHQIVVRLDMVSQQTGPVLMTSLTIDAAPPYAMPIETMATTAPTPDGPSSIPTGVVISGLVNWWSGATAYVLTSKPPVGLALTLSFANFSPLTEVRLLAPHTVPYTFPGHKDGLGAGEFWQGGSAVHVPGVVGWSSFAYDLVVVHYDTAASAWTELNANGNPSNPLDYRVYGRTIYAMGSGKVVSVRNDVPDEPISPTLPPWDQFEPLDQDDPKKRPISGNHVKILCDNGEVLTHAHLRPGSVTVKLNDAVAAGAPLGEAGNSGQSARPNVMVGCSRYAKGVPLPLSFTDICVIARMEYDPQTSSGAWYSVTEPLGLPSITSLIWPDANPPASRKVPRPNQQYRAIDPLSLIVSSSIYAMLTKPRPSLQPQFTFDEVELMRRLNESDRRGLRARIDAAKQYVAAVE